MESGEIRPRLLRSLAVEQSKFVGLKDLGTNTQLNYVYHVDIDVETLSVVGVECDKRNDDDVKSLYDWMHSLNFSSACILRMFLKRCSLAS